ncbi:hypothetical protein CPG38_09975 [Malaciobacter marinus]|uniref:hypothetical protein n=1 Tax=Malaciobacter marinus TaxID=505249 RepID=UPI000C074659|nr:hypothetical protein [Malaciobacter marinus]PHO12063.1 hypothetical protein CPG38_09975 [Malaciobacter marinus]
MALFDVDLEYIKNLDEVQLPELIHQIMFYEQSRFNLTHRGLNISLNTKTADGGSDGEFINFDKPIPEDHEFLPNKSICFQFKAAEIKDEKWLEKEISNTDKTDLSPKLKDLIEKGYLYYLISSKTDLPTQNIEDKESILKELFRSKGYNDVDVKIITATKLRDWANSIPQIYLRLNPDTVYFDRFENYQQIIRQQSEDIEYINDDDRKKGISQIRDKIEESLIQNKSTFIRIEGFSGIGKTRFVYESLNDESYKDLVLYVKSFRSSVLDDLLSFCKKLPDSSFQPVIFVIDECSYEDHIQIYKYLNTYTNFIIITIDQVLSHQDKISCPEEYRIILNGLSEKECVDLIQRVNPILPEDIARKIAYFTEGYPRLAYYMAESYDITNDDIYSFKRGDLLERIIEKVTNGNIEEVKILRAISMFKMFPNKEEYSNTKALILEHFNINRSDASIIVAKLIRKGIIREAGRFLYISPRPISIHLFNSFLDNTDLDDIDELFIKLQDNGLINSFFEKLGSVSFDSYQHKDLLFRILSKLTYENLNEDLGSRIVYTLCLKNKEQTISILNRLLKDKSKEELFELKDGRRYLVWSLDKLISFNETFNDGMKLLFRLSRAEVETWSNNSKGVFIETFQWLLGGTEVNIVNRLVLLKELFLEYEDDNDREILLKALENSYPKFNYTGSHKNHSNIPEYIPEHYEPSSQNEIDSYFEKLKELIIFFYENSSKKHKIKILIDLMHSIRIMMRYEQINFWLLDFIENKKDIHTNLEKIYFQNIGDVLKYDKEEKLSKEIVERLEAIQNYYISSEDIGDIKNIFYKAEEYKYTSEEDFEKHCKLIAQDFLKNRNFEELLNKEYFNVFRIGRKLAELEKNDKLYNDIIGLLKKIDKDSNIRFIEGYLSLNKMGGSENHEQLFKDIYTNLTIKSFTFDFIHLLKPSKVSCNYLYKLLEDRIIESSLLENLTFGFWLRDFSKEEFVAFIEKINSIIVNKSDSFDLAFQYIYEKKDLELTSKYIIYYIENGIFESQNSRVEHNIRRGIESFIKNGFKFEEKTLLCIWNSILVEFQKEGRFDGEKFHGLYEVIKVNPSFFWNLISTKLDELKPNTYPEYSKFVDFMQGGWMSNWFSHSIFNFIEPNDVINWIKTTDYEKAKYIVADSFNIDFKKDELPEIVIVMLNEFPGDKDLYSSIVSRRESWSGSYVYVANEKLKNIELMLVKYKENSNIVGFLKYYKKYYEERRDREKIRDEERDLF